MGCKKSQTDSQPTPDLSIQGESSFGHSDEVSESTGNKLTAAPDGSVFFLGTTYVDSNDFRDQLLLVKTDALGNGVWQKVYGEKFNDEPLMLAIENGCASTGKFEMAGRIMKACCPGRHVIGRLAVNRTALLETSSTVASVNRFASEVRRHHHQL